MLEKIRDAIAAKMAYEELENTYWMVMKNIDDIEALNKDFYDPTLFIDVCLKKMNNEISDEYFRFWLIIVCNVLFDAKYYLLTDYMDGSSFEDEFNEQNCREIIAYIKDFDIKLNHKDYIKYHQDNKMKVIYLRWEFYEHREGEIIFKCYIVDHANQTYDVRITGKSELDYDLSKNYCKIEDEECDSIDGSIPEKQFSKAEEQLHNLFFKSYKRDKTIQL